MKSPIIIFIDKSFGLIINQIKIVKTNNHQNIHIGHWSEAEIMDAVCVCVRARLKRALSASGMLRSKIISQVTANLLYTTTTLHAADGHGVTKPKLYK